MSVIDLWVLLGAANSLLLAIAAGVSARRDRRWAWLCTLLAMLAVVVTAILVTHRTEGWPEQVAVAVEQIAWATGPVLYHYVRHSLGYVVTLRRAWVHFLVPLGVLLVGTPLILIRGLEPLAPELLIAQQLAYTAAAILLFIRRPEQRDRSALGFWWPAIALSLMIGIHFAQLVRISPWGSQLQDAVPVIGAGGALAMLLTALLLPHQAAGRAPYAKSTLPEDRAQIIFEEALAALKDEALYRRPDLTLGDLAARINASPHHLSQALSQAGNASFKELVTGMRVHQARLLLADPDNAHVAVEPLGMEAGFRSRSAFYTAFTERVGQTPAEFRRRNAPFVSGPVGQDRVSLDEDRPAR